MNEDYPRFISNKPCGEDKFDGKSQERLARAVAKHIKKNDSEKVESCVLPKIIGVDGTWGSGKSNVIRLLENELDSDYHFFCYDAWGNQEDLQRRSILELLTSNLINNEILEGDAKIRVRGGTTKLGPWTEKLKYLLARKSEKHVEKYPKISYGTLAAILVTILTPVFTLTGILLKPDLLTIWGVITPILVAAFPLLVALIVWLIAAIIDENYRNISFLLAVYQDKIESSVSYETLSVDEPTVYEFKQWMTDISDHLKSENKQRLIIVFDNMDRLPAEKVKQLWSSIHTFFSEDGFEHIWAIIPFDEQHLSCAFGSDSDSETKKLTRYFINKTFPIVFRVSPPVITDYKGIIDAYMLEAFGEISGKQFSEVNRLYRIARSTPNVREVIVFINELVALKNLWEDQVSLISMAIYTLKRNELENDENIGLEDMVLSGEYLGDLSQHVSYTEEIQSFISALSYGIDVQSANQIPLKRYLENCINGVENSDINKYKDSNPKFDWILDDVIRNADTSTLDNIISALGELNRGSEIITLLWIDIAADLISRPIDKQELSAAYKIVLIKTEGLGIQQRVLDFFVQNMQSVNEFSGGSYYAVMSALDECIRDNELTCTYELDEIEIDDVEDQIYYVTAAKQEFTRYKLRIDGDRIDSWLATKAKAGAFYYSVVEILVENEYKFKSLKLAVEEQIKSDLVANDNLLPLYKVYQLISDGKLLDKIPIESLKKMLIENRPSTDQGMQDEYVELAAMAIAYGINEKYISDNITEQIASRIQNYIYYGDLLVQCVNYEYGLCVKVTKYLLENSFGRRVMALEEVLPIFFSIVSVLGIDDKILLADFNKWAKYVANRITVDNIKECITDKKMWIFLIEEGGDLTDALTQIASDKVKGLTAEELYEARIVEDYWGDVTAIFLERNIISHLSSNLIEYGRTFLGDFVNKTQGIPCLDLDNAILTKLNHDKVKDILLKLANKIISGDFEIDKSKFLFVEQYMRLANIFGEVTNGYAGAVTYYIEPVLADYDCLNMILENQTYYADIINKSGDVAYATTEKIRNLKEKAPSAELISFATLVGIESTSE